MQTKNKSIVEFLSTWMSGYNPVIVIDKTEMALNRFGLMIIDEQGAYYGA